MIPTLLKFKDLKAAGIVSNWTTLLRWIDAGNFPQGIKIGPHTRAWTEQSIAEWLDARQQAFNRRG
jgi:predicted DNA-binding transcriptional regulator AlpA